MPLNQVAKCRRLAVQTGPNTLFIRLQYPLLTSQHKAGLYVVVKGRPSFATDNRDFSRKKRRQPFTGLDAVNR